MQDGEYHNKLGSTEEQASKVEPAQPATQSKQKPTKNLPSDRLSFDTQLSILRAYAAASGPSKNLISNADVEKVSAISASSISICNPFFNSIGLIEREGHKGRPAQTVFDYAHGYEWDADNASKKLAPLLEKTWFAKALIPKLSFRDLQKSEAVTYLAEESKASLDYRRQLELLIEYLGSAGLVKVEGNTIKKAKADKRQRREVEKRGEKEEKPANQEENLSPQNSDTFTIPIPGKEPVLVSVPKDLDVDDWAMFATMLEIYIKRLKKWNSGQIESATKNYTVEDVS